MCYDLVVAALISVTMVNSVEKLLAPVLGDNIYFPLLFLNWEVINGSRVLSEDEVELQFKKPNKLEYMRIAHWESKEFPGEVYTRVFIKTGNGKSGVLGINHSSGGVWEARLCRVLELLLEGDRGVEEVVSRCSNENLLDPMRTATTSLTYRCSANPT